MEYQNIVKLLDTTFDDKYLPRFVTKKQIKADDQLRGIYNSNKQTRFKTSMVQADLCDYRDEYIVVKGIINVLDAAKTASERVV